MQEECGNYIPIRVRWLYLGLDWQRSIEKKPGRCRRYVKGRLRCRFCRKWKSRSCMLPRKLTRSRKSLESLPKTGGPRNTPSPIRQPDTISMKKERYMSEREWVVRVDEPDIVGQLRLALNVFDQQGRPVSL